ncbi:MAG: methyltransferase type 11 [uncultured bacterium]|nr:MAG: methyltransferase type 11 [uncultured bacterium]
MYSEYLRIEKLENYHFWYRAMEELAIDLIKKYCPKRKLKILDAGCGSGGMTQKLTKFGHVTGIDINEKALKLAKQKKIDKVMKTDVCNLPFHDSSFDLVTSFDVIYHQGVIDDLKALKEMYRVLKPNGILLLRVPALESLRGSHDIAVKTRYRYTAYELKHKMLLAGFNTRKISYLNMVLSTILLIKRSTERLTTNVGKSEVKKLPIFVNNLFYIILSTYAP